MVVGLANTLPMSPNCRAPPGVLAQLEVWEPTVAQG
jgi:hypothetical protein